MTDAVLKAIFPVFNGLAPATIIGARALPVNLPFSGTVSRVTFDLVKEEQAGSIGNIQSVWVDNADNPEPLILTFGKTGQRIKVPAYTQQTRPVISGSNLQVIAESIGEIPIDIIFMNVPMPESESGPVTINVANVTATFTPTPGTWQNFSGQTTAGVSTTLFAANTAAIRRMVQNPANNPESIWINFGGTAATAGAPSIEIPPGGSFDTGTGPIDRTVWTVISVNAVFYAAKEMEALP